MICVLQLHRGPGLFWPRFNDQNLWEIWDVDEVILFHKTFDRNVVFGPRSEFRKSENMSRCLGDQLSPFCDIYDIWHDIPGKNRQFLGRFFLTLGIVPIVVDFIAFCLGKRVENFDQRGVRLCADSSKNRSRRKSPNRHFLGPNGPNRFNLEI